MSVSSCIVFTDTHCPTEVKSNQVVIVGNQVVRGVQRFCLNAMCTYCGTGEYQNEYTDCSTCLKCTTEEDCCEGQEILTNCSSDRNAVCGCPPCTTITCPPSTTPDLPVEPSFQQNCPSDITIEAEEGATGGAVTWTEPVVSNASAAVQSHYPGDTFRIGYTDVFYAFSGSTGNMITCSFVINVKEAPRTTSTVDPVSTTTEQPEISSRCVNPVPNTTEQPDSGQFSSCDGQTVCWVLLGIITVVLVLFICQQESKSESIVHTIFQLTGSSILACRLPSIDRKEQKLVCMAWLLYDEYKNPIVFGGVYRVPPYLPGSPVYFSLDPSWSPVSMPLSPDLSLFHVHTDEGDCGAQPRQANGNPIDDVDQVDNNCNDNGDPEHRHLLGAEGNGTTEPDNPQGANDKSEGNAEAPLVVGVPNDKDAIQMNSMGPSQSGDERYAIQMNSMGPSQSGDERYVNTRLRSSIGPSDQQCQFEPQELGDEEITEDEINKVVDEAHNHYGTYFTTVDRFCSKFGMDRNYYRRVLEEEKSRAVPDQLFYAIVHWHDQKPQKKEAFRKSLSQVHEQLGISYVRYVNDRKNDQQ
ncbi:putative hyalin-like isoform X2 [Apostichopus japonicus]|uniref:Putative hyalin-like isoform X2 n=1 Tax=Stichopus japonicus TaxID=307972 RepID=A0A2G8JDQ4_STIJA|nr:putative hyalin-like isoform X2 [Apostichopus japonicus]